MRPRNILAALLFGFALIVGGCGNMGSTAGLSDAEKAQLTPTMRVYAAKADFDTLLDKIVAYAEQPQCSETVVVACSDPKVVETANRLAMDVDKALDEAETVARSGTGDVDSSIGAARQALGTLSAYLVSKQITKGATP